MNRFIRLCIITTALLLAACGRNQGDALDIAFVGDTKDPFETGLRLSSAGQHVRGATREGLVSTDAAGRVIPALADRWNVTDDAQTYIFRLREGVWPDGSELTGESARAALQRAIRGLRNTPLGLDLSQISEIRTMAGRVVEIRLKGPMPDFLQLLAQPELGLTRNGGPMGPMTARRIDNIAVLSMMAPEKRGLPVREGWENEVRELRLRSLTAEQAVAAFYDGEVDIVLNGRIASFPLVETGPLSRGTVRLDPAIGLFGLQVMRANGILETALGRETLAMAIDRDAMMAPFNVGGWTPTTRIVTADLPNDLGTIGERWAGMPLEARRQTASARVAAWRAENEGVVPEVLISLPQGPGGEILLSRLTQDLAAVGITLRRPRKGERASLQMLDRVARYADARWFLNQFNCSLKLGVCSSQADTLVGDAGKAQDPNERAALLAEAEAELTAQNAYIPFGPPIRWSLVRGWVTGFEVNRQVFHPLPDLATLPK